MVDCKNYRYQNNQEEWCREGLNILFCQNGKNCPFYEKCQNDWDLEERHYPEEN